MSHRYMSEEMAIKHHFAQSRTLENGTMRVCSSFGELIESARKLTGRHPINGGKVVSENRSSWLGVLAYLILLDQIGGCFKPKTEVLVQNKNEVQKALHYFSNRLGPQEVDAIYALRCCLAHDFNLCNINNKNLSLTHHFGISYGSQEKVIKLPKVSWDGDYENRNNDNRTFVDVERLCSLVEDACYKLFALRDQNQLDCILPGGTDELLQRYGIFAQGEYKNQGTQ